MPTDTISIDMPPPTTSAPTAAPDPAGGTEKLGNLFDSLHAENTGAPAPAAPAAAPAQPATPPPAEEFVPPEILFGGETPPTKPAESEMPSVADLMPEEAPVSIRTEKGKADYKKWREHQLMLETKLKERNGTSEPPSDLVARNKELEQRLAEMSSVTERVALMEHPAFKQQFIVPRQQMLSQAKEAIEMAGGDVPAFEKMLGLSGKARIDAIDTLMEDISSPTLRNQLGNMISGIENLDRQRDAVMADVKGNHERLELQTRAQRQQQMEAQEKETASTLDSAIEHLRDKAGFEFFKEVPGNEKWNAQVKQARENSLYILTKASPAEAITAAALAPQAPMYRTAYQGAMKRVRTLEAEIAELKGAQPRIGDGGGALDAPTNGDEHSGLANIFKRAASGGVFGS